MSSLEVVFEVPEQIVAGLATGSLQRIGGVVVDSGSKQVVAWLRDGSINRSLDNTHLPTSLISSLSAAGAGTSLASLAVGGIVLNLALAAISFRQILNQLDRLSQDVYRLSEELKAEFARDRDSEFRNALKTARDGFESEHAENRRHMLLDAAGRLHAASENFIQDFQKNLKVTSDGQGLVVSQYLLPLAMHAEVTRIRCFLATEDIEFAKRRLKEDVELFKLHTRQLVSRLMGENPAIYLHKLIGTDDVRRFLRIQQWLHTDDLLNSQLDIAVLLQIIDKLRKDFWQSELATLVEEDNSLPSQFARTSGQFVGEIIGRLGHPVANNNKSAGKAEQLIQKLSYAELAIENYERLLGFELEVRSFRLASFHEWSHLVNDDDLEKQGIGIIVDRERLERLSL